MLVVLSCSVTQPCIYVLTCKCIFQCYLLETYSRYVFTGIKMCSFLFVYCSATVVKEREDESRSRGFGFVTFYESKHVDDAVYQLNDTVSRLCQKILFIGPIICERESVLSEMA